MLVSEWPDARLYEPALNLQPPMIYAFAVTIWLDIVRHVVYTLDKDSDHGRALGKWLN